MSPNQTSTMEEPAAAAAESASAAAGDVPKKKQTLKVLLHSTSSPKDVLQGPFDYAYGDTITMCTRLLQDNHGWVQQWQYFKCFSLRRSSKSAHSSSALAGATREVLFRRLSTFPPSKRKLPSFKKAGAIVKFMSKVSPLATDEPRHGWTSFTLAELQAATECFNAENLIGKGGCADVYRGLLRDGRTVAVKRLIRGDKEEQFTSFLTELGVLGHICHPNTTPLTGFCIEGGLFLVFDFFPCGSLATMLHGQQQQVMEWPARFKVAVGTARGLHYLHTRCKRRIIHRDIKASNILLGPDLEPQITDFGLAKWLPAEWTHLTVPVEGTFGYLAPEYFMHGIVDEKTDVFAFGVLLLELITGTRPIDSSQKSLVMKVKPLLESGEVQKVVDSRLAGRYDGNQMSRTILAAKFCVRQSAIARPCMGEVVKMLVEGRSDSSPTRSSSLWDKCGPGEDEVFVVSCHQKDMRHHAALAFGASC